MSEKKGYQLSCRFHLHHTAPHRNTEKVDGRCTAVCNTGPNLQSHWLTFCFKCQESETITAQYVVKYMFRIYFKWICANGYGCVKKCRIERCDFFFFATVVSVFCPLCNLTIPVWISSQSVHTCNKFVSSQLQSLIIYMFMLTWHKTLLYATSKGNTWCDWNFHFIFYISWWMQLLFCISTNSLSSHPPSFTWTHILKHDLPNTWLPVKERVADTKSWLSKIYLIFLPSLQWTVRGGKGHKQKKKKEVTSHRHCGLCSFCFFFSL